MANPRTVWKFSILTFVVLHCMTGLVEAVMVSYVLLRRFSVRFFFESLRLSILASFSAPFIILVTAALGWHSVSNIRPRLIKTFSVFLGLTVALEMSVSVWCFAAQQEFPRTLTLSLNQKFQEQFKTNTSDWWDVLQSEFHCCGVSGPSDYVSLHNKVPASCFAANERSVGGCLVALKEAGSEDFGIVALTFIIAACLQLPGVFVSWCFANRIAMSGI